MKKSSTIEYLGIWERVHNPVFNYGEFDLVKTKRASTATGWVHIAYFKHQGDNNA